jgi:hypothetical protein
VVFDVRSDSDEAGDLLPIRQHHITPTAGILTHRTPTIKCRDGFDQTDRPEIWLRAAEFGVEIMANCRCLNRGDTGWSWPIPVARCRNVGLIRSAVLPRLPKAPSVVGGPHPNGRTLGAFRPPWTLATHMIDVE